MSVMATSINVACHICGDIEVAPTDVVLVLNGPDNFDVRFTHCDTTTRRRLTVPQAMVLRVLDVLVVDERPVSERHCSCGLAMFPIGTIAACRNCDAPMAGLPPADKTGFRR